MLNDMFKAIRSKKLFTAILLFIVLDLSILVINFWIAYQVSEDAVAINLAGRQRMLSQRMTKALLVYQFGGSPAEGEAALEEFKGAALMFNQTLAAFVHGGTAVGGDGRNLELRQIKNQEAQQLLGRATSTWQPIYVELSPYLSQNLSIPAVVMQTALVQMQQKNLNLLALMNQLTSSLERDSKRRINMLRIIQTAVFLLALFNFVVIVRQFHLLSSRIQQERDYFNQLSVRDALTGLFNRREYERRLADEVAVASRRSRDGFAIVMIDLDGFKPINDQYGHETGDIVLKELSQRLVSHARETDIVARLGGDEFALICTGLRSKVEVEVFCDRLLAAITQPILLDSRVAVQAGASIGVALCINKADSDVNLQHRADQAMYEAKRMGGNRFVITTSA